MVNSLIDIIQIIPGEIYAATGTFIIGYLAHQRANVTIRNKERIDRENNRKAWFEVELDYISKNQDLLQQNLDKSIERLEKDRAYQDRRIEKLEKDLDDISEKHSKCMEDYFIISTSYERLINNLEEKDKSKYQDFLL